VETLSTSFPPGNEKMGGKKNINIGKKHTKKQQTNKQTPQTRLLIPGEWFHNYIIMLLS